MTLDERAQKACEELSARYKKLDELWQQAEKEILRFHIPCGVVYEYDNHCIDAEETSDVHVSYCLGIQEVYGELRICHSSYSYWANYASEYHESEPVWTPICECSPEVRVRAVEHLPGLREKVVETAEHFIPKVDEAIIKISRVLPAASASSATDDDSPF
jgi:hypothetical protein